MWKIIYHVIFGNSGKKHKHMLSTNHIFIYHVQSWTWDGGGGSVGGGEENGDGGGGDG